jgi:hypothetical protein
MVNAEGVTLPKRVLDYMKQEAQVEWAKLTFSDLGARQTI